MSENQTNYSKLQGKNILAIDYGSKVLGLAKYCPGREPFPYPVGKIVVQTESQVLKDLLTVIEDETIEVLVVGLPHFLDGKPTVMTQTVRAFAQKLHQQTPTLPLYFQDETLTTKEAEERMKKSPRYHFKVDPKSIDEVSATIILEDFISKTASPPDFSD